MASTASASKLSTGTSNTQSATSLSGAAAGKKRQRGRRMVTALACTECQKKRAKCDGQQPCRRCSTQDAECYYKVPMRQSKMNLRNTIEQLRHQQASSELIINTLCHGKQWKEVLSRLRKGQSVEDIANWLGNQHSLGDGAIPSPSHFPSTDSKLSNFTNLENVAGVGDSLYTSEISEESASATSTVSSMSSDYLSVSRYDEDTNSQWSQYLEASQAPSNSGNSQPATDSSETFASDGNNDNFATTWGDSVLLSVAPSQASSAVATWDNSIETSMFWPFPMQGGAILPTGNAFLDAGFDLF